MQDLRRASSQIDGDAFRVLSMGRGLLEDDYHAQDFISADHSLNVTG